MTRQEHLDWCKKRTLEDVRRESVRDTLVKFVACLGEHKETKNHPNINPMTVKYLAGEIVDADAMRRFIEGFN